MPILPTLCNTGKSNGLQLRLLEGTPSPELGSKTFFFTRFLPKTTKLFDREGGSWIRQWFV